MAIAWLIVQSVFGLRLLAVQTGSMRPTFKPGDALILKRSSFEAIQQGQVVAYRSSRNPDELISHRVVAVDAATRRFQTQGDAVSVADPAVGANLLVGHMLAILPGLGTMLNWLRTLPGLITCVYLPAIFIAIGELRRLERQYRRFRVYQVL